MMKFDTSGLLGPQGDHALRILNSLCLNGVAADMSETGCGKTYVAAKVASVINKPIVVVCPKMVIPKWHKTLAEYGVKASLIINYEKLCRGNTPYLKYDKRQPHLKDNDRPERCLTTKIKLPAGALVILDESHKCKGQTSLNAGLMLALKRQGYMVLTLSATQATNPLDMRAFGYTFNLHKDKDPDEKWNKNSFAQFCLDSGAEELGKWGALTYNLEDKEALAKMGWIHENLFDFQRNSSRLTRDEMGALFPENQVLAECFDTGNDAKIAQIWEDMELEMVRLEETCADYSQHIFAVIMKARREAELLKVPAMVQMAEDFFDEGKSVVLFVSFTDTVEAISKRLNHIKGLKGKIGYVIGGRDKKNLQDVEDFQSDKLRMLVCNIAAGGVAIDLHDLNGKFPRASIINPNFSAIMMNQALGRIHRQGGLTKCHQVLFFANVAIEQKICRRVQSRINNMGMLTDGDLLDKWNYFGKYFSNSNI